MRKIVKLEERIVHFLDDKQTVRQTDWDHIYSEACQECTLYKICGGLFDRGNGYDPKELYPVFVSMQNIVEKIINDPTDPSYKFRSFERWQEEFTRYNEKAVDKNQQRQSMEDNTTAVGKVTHKSLKLYESKRSSESKKAKRHNVNLEEQSPLNEL